MCFYTMLQFKENIPNCFKEIKKIYKKTKKIYFVDNCSTDNTIELIKIYKNKFKINNLFIIKNKKIWGWEVAGKSV